MLARPSLFRGVSSAGAGSPVQEQCQVYRLVQFGRYTASLSFCTLSRDLLLTAFCGVVVPCVLGPAWSPLCQAEAAWRQVGLIHQCLLYRYMSGLCTHNSSGQEVRQHCCLSFIALQRKVKVSFVCFHGDMVKGKEMEPKEGIL